MEWAQTLTFDNPIWGPVFVFMALAFALVLALLIPLGIRNWKLRRLRPRVTASVEAIPSLRVEGSFRAIRIILHNRGTTRTTVEEIIFCRRPSWFEFGIIGPLVRLNGLSPWRLNVGIASRGVVHFPITLDADGSWETVIPLELENPNNHEELRRLERYSQAVKVLRSRAMRYAIQFSYRAEATGDTESYTNHNLDGWVNLASY